MASAKTRPRSSDGPHELTLATRLLPGRQLVRIRSRDGNFRFELNPTDDISVLVAKVSWWTNRDGWSSSVARPLGLRRAASRARARGDWRGGGSRWSGLEKRVDAED